MNKLAREDFYCESIYLEVYQDKLAILLTIGDFKVKSENQILFFLFIILRNKNAIEKNPDYFEMRHLFVNFKTPQCGNNCIGRFECF